VPKILLYNLTICEGLFMLIRRNLDVLRLELSVLRAPIYTPTPQSFSGRYLPLRVSFA